MNTPTSAVTVLFSGLPASSDSFLPGISTVALVQSHGRLIIFDTGPYAYRPIQQGRLRKLGIDPGKVDTVILSHVHWDSAARSDPQSLDEHILKPVISQVRVLCGNDLESSASLRYRSKSLEERADASDNLLSRIIPLAHHGDHLADRDRSS